MRSRNSQIDCQDNDKTMSVPFQLGFEIPGVSHVVGSTPSRFYSD